MKGLENPTCCVPRRDILFLGLGLGLLLSFQELVVGATLLADPLLTRTSPPANVTRSSHSAPLRKRSRISPNAARQWVTVRVGWELSSEQRL